MTCGPWRHENVFNIDMLDAQPFYDARGRCRGAGGRAPAGGAGGPGLRERLYMYHEVATTRRERLNSFLPCDRHDAVAAVAAAAGVAAVPRLQPEGGRGLPLARVARRGQLAVHVRPVPHRREHANGRRLVRGVREGRAVPQLRKDGRRGVLCLRHACTPVRRRRARGAALAAGASRTAAAAARSRSSDGLLAAAAPCATVAATAVGRQAVATEPTAAEPTAGATAAVATAGAAAIAAARAAAALAAAEPAAAVAATAGTATAVAAAVAPALAATAAACEPAALGAAVAATSIAAAAAALAAAAAEAAAATAAPARSRARLLAAATEPATVAAGATAAAATVAAAGKAHGRARRLRLCLRLHSVRPERRPAARRARHAVGRRRRVCCIDGARPRVPALLFARLRERPGGGDGPHPRHAG